MFLFQTSEVDFYKALALFVPIIAVIVTFFLTRKKNASEVDTNYNKIIFDLRKENNELSDKLADVRGQRDEKIAVIRADCDNKIAISNAKTVEVYEKLDNWIKRVEVYANDSLQADENLADLQAELQNCLESKSQSCRTCIKKALDIFHKIETTLLEYPQHKELIAEMWKIRGELENKEND